MEKRERIYEVERDWVPPNETTTIRQQSIRIPRSDSGIAGYPETQVIIESGVEHPFRISWIDVEEKCRPHFSVIQCYVGQAGQWDCAESGVSAEILAKKPSIAFTLVSRGTFITLSVRNTSTIARPFRARLIGVEESWTKGEKEYA